MSLLTEQLLEDRVAFLRQSGLWTNLSDGGLRALAAAMHAREYRSGDLIIQQGEQGSHLSVLTAGQAEVRVRTEGGTAITVATFREGDCFGEMSLLSGDPTSADVVAVEDSKTLALDREAFDFLVAANPNLLREFVRMISRRLTATDKAVGVAREMEQEITRFLHEQKSEQYGDLAGSRLSRELARQVEKQATLDTPLLIQGERGTGKELLARLVHFHSGRKESPLLSTECAQIAETPWGDKLFGDYHHGGSRGPRAHAVCYMDLAEGGTLLLKNVDALPPAIQERLGRFLDDEAQGPDALRRNVRIIATCRGDLASGAVSGQVSPVLVSGLLEHVITLPPLRERKRDIPELADRFMHKHAQRLNKQVNRLDDQAVIKLVSYDYLIANVQELEEAIERAVILTDDEVIDAEEIFLGPPREVRAWGINLLGLPKPLVELALRLFPSVIQGFAAAVFAFLLYQCFFASAQGGGNLGTILVWSVWWPALVLSFFFVGRAWCAICPMALAGSAAQRVTNPTSRIPAWLKDYGTYVMMAGFFAIIWVEEVTGMRYAPPATGLLLLFILTGALIASILFPRRTWCRHICPLGGFAGLCSTSAMLELRPTLDICAAKCKGHSCYKGEGGIAGCPMFNHLMFVDSNQDCVLCMACVRSCPDGSPQLNLRIPARELWSSQSGRPEVGRFVALLLGLLMAQTLIDQLDRQPQRELAWLLAEHRGTFLTGVLALAAAIPLLCLWLGTRRLGKSPDPVAATQFWQKVAAWAPLLTAGYVCHQLTKVPGLDRLHATVGYESLGGDAPRSAVFSLLSASQLGILSAGLVVTLGVLWKLWGTTEGGKETNWERKRAVSLVAVVAYWAAILVVMLRPGWLPG